MNKIYSFPVALLLLFGSMIFFITCQKEYSYEGGALPGSTSGTAVYNFISTGNLCSGAVTGGNYYKGISLSASNTIQLQVDVTAAGTYSLSTGSANGISFSASGVFTNTGIQAITLTGSGTAVSTGSFSFSTPVNPSCSFQVTVSDAPVAVAVYNLAGSPGFCTNASIHGDYISGATLTNSNAVDITVDVISIGTYTLKTDTLDGISFSKTGTFTNTGVQTVTLVGSGTAISSRNLSFTIQPGISGCTFQVAVLTGPPYATYVLESGSGNPNPCIYSVSGNYISGTVLSNMNTVSIRVFVTVLGNFSIATDMINGMLFSFSGTFTTLGTQVVTLAGTGTPAAMGTYTFIPKIVGPHPIGGEACAFVITVN